MTWQEAARAFQVEHIDAGHSVDMRLPDFDTMVLRCEDCGLELTVAADPTPDDAFVVVCTCGATAYTEHVGSRALCKPLNVS